MSVFDDAVRAADDLIRRLGNARLADAARQLPDTDQNAWRLADDLLKHPKAIDRTDQFLGDNGLQLGRHVGSGAESLVWEVSPRAGGPAHVLKVRPDGLTSDFDLPEGVPGVVPYWAKEQVDPKVAVALQQRADVYAPKQGLELPFSQAATRVKKSLLARGWDWGDSHKQNLGVLPSGEWGVVDGWMFHAHPAWTRPDISPEEAIRMLRVTPWERSAIYGIDAP